MKMTTDTHQTTHTRMSTVLALFLLAAGMASAATQWWDAAATAGVQSGPGAWSTGSAFWATNSNPALNDGPYVWVNNNDAVFSVATTSTVNGVTANSTTFSAAGIILNPGAGVLTNGAGGMSFTLAGSELFGCDVVLSAPQSWTMTAAVNATITGRVSGAALTLQPGTGTFALTNANNSFSSLTLANGGTLVAQAGANVLGTGPVNIGPTTGSLLSNPTLTINGQGTTATQIGDLTISSPATLILNSTASTNYLNAGNLTRVGRATLAFNPASQTFTREIVTFTGGTNLSNGFLPPWMFNSPNKAFLTYAGGVTNANTVSLFSPNSSTQWISLLANTNLTTDTAAYLLKSAWSVNLNGNTLRIGNSTNAGLMFTSGSIVNSGSAGSLDFQGAEALILNPASGDTGLIAVPITNAAGLTKFGNGTLTISNAALCAGDIALEGGAMVLKNTADLVLTNNIVGTTSLTKGLPTSLTLAGSTGAVASLTISDGGTLKFANSVYTNQGVVTIGNSGSSLVLTNSQLWEKGTLTIGAGINNVTLLVLGGGPGCAPTVLDGGKSGLNIGTANATGNVLRVDGGGVTGGALISNMIYNTTGLAVGNGAQSFRNSAAITNGGVVWDEITVVNVSNGIGLGSGASSNSLTIVGGSGFTSVLYKAFANSIGGGIGANGNSVTVDGAGTPGSAYWRGGGGITVGSGGASGNQLNVTNGGYALITGVTIGNNASSNRVNVVGTGSTFAGTGGDSVFYIGAGCATGNVLYVGNGGVVSNFNKWTSAIGGLVDSGYYPGTNLANAIVITTNGRCFIPNGMTVGVVAGPGSMSISNQVLVTGSNALWSVSSLTIGSAVKGSANTGNWVQVDGGGVLSVGALNVGNISDTNNGGTLCASMLIITNGGQVTSTAATIGRGVAAPFAAATGTALSNSALVAGGPAGVSLWSLGNSALTIGSNLASNNMLTVLGGGTVSNVSTLTLGTTNTSGGGSLTVANGGNVYVTTLLNGGSTGGSPSPNNTVSLTAAGLLEANTISNGVASGNAINNNGGVYQFTTITPLIAPNGNPITINGGSISYRNLGTVDVRGNLGGNGLTNLTWSGDNGFRLTAASNTTASSQNYIFEPGISPTTYARLEMVGGSTCYRGQITNSLSIGLNPGSSASMLCSNTAAVVAIPFTNNGTLRIVNSTLTFTTNAVINGTVFVDLNKLANTGTVLIAQRDLTLGGSSTLQFVGTPTNNLTLMTYTGARSGRFTITGLPYNYSVFYGAGQNGAVFVNKTAPGTVLLIL